MAWEELREELKQLKVNTVESASLWQVTTVGVGTFHAHPLFLDDLRRRRELAELLTSEAKAAIAPLRKWRIVLDSRLDEARQARTSLGIGAPGCFEDVAALIPLMQHYDTIKNLGAVYAFPTLLADATTFADTQSPNANVGDFIQLHALYVNAVQGLLRASGDGIGGPAVTNGNRAALVTDAYNKGIAAAARAGVGRLGLNAASAWSSHETNFATTAKQRAAELKFATNYALVGHAFKHLIREPEKKEDKKFPGDQNFMNALVDKYLSDARRKITDTDAASVTSAVGQLGGHRTYYHGIVLEHTAMVAVNEAGEAWISTFYAPDRL